MPGLSELFAPAYNASDPNSKPAVNAWQAANFAMTNPLVEQTRTPVPYNTGYPAGQVDTEALRVLAQGGPYDMNARRNAIAAQVQANQNAAAAAPAAQQSAAQSFGGGGGVQFGPGYSGGGPVAPGVLPPQVNLGVS